MCDPVTGLILTGLASGGTALANNRNLKKQDRIAASGIIKQRQNQGEANARVMQQIGDIAGNTGEAERSESLENFRNALLRGREQTEGALQPVAGANARFAEDVAGARSGLRSRGSEMAERLSVIDGILRQRQNEGTAVGDTRLDLANIASNSQADDFLTRLQVNNQRVNPWVTAALGVLKGVGSGIALKAPGVPASGPSIIGEAGVPIGGAGAVNPFRVAPFRTPPANPFTRVGGP